jgi:hypothetical protein
MDWARILAYVTGTVDRELLTQIEYLAAENRILKTQLKRQLFPPLVSTLCSRIRFPPWAEQSTGSCLPAGKDRAVQSAHSPSRSCQAEFWSMNHPTKHTKYLRDVDRQRFRL